MNTPAANDNGRKHSNFRFRGMMQPTSMTRTECAHSLLNILREERRYSPAHARQYRLVAWVLGGSILPS